MRLQLGLLVFLPEGIQKLAFPAIMGAGQPSVPAFRPGHYVRPASCVQFPPSNYKAMFKALDTNHDGYLSPGEFQVHRNEMHGPRCRSRAGSPTIPAPTSACPAAKA